MLRRIIEENENAPFVLIKDDDQTDGNPLLNAFITVSTKRKDSIFILQYDTPKQALKDIVKYSDVQLFDGVTDPLNWNNRNYEGNIISYDLEKTTNSVGSGLFVINSLTPLLLNNSPNELFRQLFNLKTKKVGCKVVALIHSEIHDSMELKIIERLADAVLTLSVYKSNKTLTSCSTFLKKPNGKLSIDNELYKIDSNFALHVESPNDIASKETPVTIDPASNLTFNLNLKDDEKLARQDLVLPYTQVTSMTQGGGNIIYNPDIADDFDEDDPDDDLDI